MSPTTRPRRGEAGGAQTKIYELFKETKPVRELRRKLSVKPPVPPHEDSYDAEEEEIVVNENQVTESEGGDIKEAKRALHISAPGTLPCREGQVEEVMEFVRENLVNGTPGSMYIAGAPGTGKTAVVMHVISMLKDEMGKDGKKRFNFLDVIVNCMNLKEPSVVFEAVAKKLNIKAPKGADLVQRISNRAVSKTARPAVIVLDEMDQLLSGSKDLLYRAFEWTRLPGSKFILIGIANSLDLTVRHVPLLTSSPKAMSPKARTPVGAKNRIVKQEINTPQPSKLMQFPPYERTDIEKILESRMNEVGKDVFDPVAIKFVAAKVSASTGDMRKALNACQKALDLTEKSQRPILKATADDGFNSSSPKKMCGREDKIGIAAMSKILAPKKEEGTLPLQQKIILATLLKINKEAPNSVNIPQDGVTAPIPMTAFYEAYRKVCTDKGLSWVDRSELSSILELLEDRDLVHVSESSKGTPAKKAKGVKSGKASVFFQLHAVLNLVRNDAVVDSIVG